MNLHQSELALDRLYALAAEQPHVVCMTQPMGDGVIKEFTWSEVLLETRKMASHLIALNLPSESKVAILSKNTAYWLMTDWAIWMAGLISVPLYPTLSIMKSVGSSVQVPGLPLEASVFTVAPLATVTLLPEVSTAPPTPPKLPP